MNNQTPVITRSRTSGFRPMEAYSSAPNLTFGQYYVINVWRSKSKQLEPDDFDFLRFATGLTNRQIENVVETLRLMDKQAQLAQMNKLNAFTMAPDVRKTSPPASDASNDTSLIADTSKSSQGFSDQSNLSAIDTSCSTLAETSLTDTNLTGTNTDTSMCHNDSYNLKSDQSTLSNAGTISSAVCESPEIIILSPEPKTTNSFSESSKNFNEAQLDFLEKFYEHLENPTVSHCYTLAETIEANRQDVVEWFEARRARYALHVPANKQPGGGAKTSNGRCSESKKANVGSKNRAENVKVDPPAPNYSIDEATARFLLHMTGEEFLNLLHASCQASLKVLTPIDAISKTLENIRKHAHALQQTPAQIFPRTNTPDAPRIQPRLYQHVGQPIPNVNQETYMPHTKGSDEFQAEMRHLDIAKAEAEMHALVQSQALAQARAKVQALAQAKARAQALQASGQRTLLNNWHAPPPAYHPYYQPMPYFNRPSKTDTRKTEMNNNFKEALTAASNRKVMEIPVEENHQLPNILKRPRFTEHQIKILERRFSKNIKCKDNIDELMTETGLAKLQIQRWYSKRRMKAQAEDSIKTTMASCYSKPRMSPEQEIEEADEMIDRILFELRNAVMLMEQILADTFKPSQPRDMKSTSSTTTPTKKAFSRPDSALSGISSGIEADFNESTSSSSPDVSLELFQVSSPETIVSPSELENKRKLVVAAQERARLEANNVITFDEVAFQKQLLDYYLHYWAGYYWTAMHYNNYTVPMYPARHVKWIYSDFVTDQMVVLKERLSSPKRIWSKSDAEQFPEDVQNWVESQLQAKKARIEIIEL